MDRERLQGKLNDMVADTGLTEKVEKRQKTGTRRLHAKSLKVQTGVEKIKNRKARQFYKKNKQKIKRRRARTTSRRESEEVMGSIVEAPANVIEMLLNVLDEYSGSEAQYEAIAPDEDGTGELRLETVLADDLFAWLEEGEDDGEEDDGNEEVNEDEEDQPSLDETEIAHVRIPQAMIEEIDSKREQLGIPEDTKVVSVEATTVTVSMPRNIAERLQRGFDVELVEIEKDEDKNLDEAKGDVDQDKPKDGNKRVVLDFLKENEKAIRDGEFANAAFQLRGPNMSSKWTNLTIADLKAIAKALK